MVKYAHSGRLADRSDWQPLSDHLAATSKLAAERGRLIGLAASADTAGRFHDLGKYDPQFDRVLRGEPGPVFDHSSAGGRVLIENAAAGLKPIAEVLAYAILGHHAGLPDKSADDKGAWIDALKTRRTCSTRNGGRIRRLICGRWVKKSGLALGSIRKRLASTFLLQ